MIVPRRGRTGAAVKAGGSTTVGRWISRRVPRSTPSLNNDQQLEVLRFSPEGEVSLAKLKDVPLADAGKDVAQTENVLAAVAAAWALGVSQDVMRTGIETYFIEQQ